MKPQKCLLTWCVAGLIGAAVATAPLSGQAGKMYKWVDNDGSVTYQDKPPPGEATVMPGDPDTTSATADADATQQSGENQPVTLFSVPVCESCDLVRMILDQNKVPFDEKNVEGNVAAQKELEETAGQLTVPVLVIGDKAITGFSISEIHQQLVSAGYTLAQRRVPEQSEESPNLDQSGSTAASDSGVPGSESKTY